MRRFLIALLLTLSLFACSTIPTTRYIVKQPPLEYTDQVDIPKFNGTTVDDLQLYTLDLVGHLKKCNLSKSKLLEWYDEVESNLAK